MNNLDFENLWNTDLANLKKYQTSYFEDLTKYHQDHSKTYSMLTKFQKKDRYENIDEIPMLPVSIFKEIDLLSVSLEEVFKIVTSSGTSGQKPSKIFLDKVTSQDQVRVLTKTVAHSIGPHRLPMLLLDSPGVLKARNQFTARGAGILGFSIFASKKYYALDENMELNIDEIEKFYAENQGSNLLMYGFTYIIWSQIVQKLLEQNLCFTAEKIFVIHGGGWKKLIEHAVDRKQFNLALNETLGATKILNYYGMAEQTGSIYMECGNGYLHTTPYNSILVRDFRTLKEVETGQFGYIHSFSTIPKSYAGHSLLTEDVGRVIYQGNCPCGANGIAFEIMGRVKQAEVRGCSDTFEK